MMLFLFNQLIQKKLIVIFIFLILPNMTLFNDYSTMLCSYMTCSLTMKILIILLLKIIILNVLSKKVLFKRNYTLFNILLRMQHIFDFSQMVLLLILAKNQ